jgi:hypothetical protein
VNRSWRQARHRVICGSLHVVLEGWTARSTGYTAALPTRGCYATSGLKKRWKDDTRQWCSWQELCGEPSAPTNLALSLLFRSHLSSKGAGRRAPVDIARGGTRSPAQGRGPHWVPEGHLVSAPLFLAVLCFSFSWRSSGHSWVLGFHMAAPPGLQSMTDN